MNGLMRRKSERGFTLIELLVVVLIIGILASIAIPQYFKVVERARVSEGHNFISSVKQAQERYLARQGRYVTQNADIGQLDIDFSGTTPTFGMTNYNATLAAGGGTCDPKYNVAVRRLTTVAGLATRYGAAYTILYERCTAAITYPSCANCTIDFGV
ncbi:MAG: hypothetical protein A2X36_17205 [Elusimicrobia bacterium GWA2_69_24]|nr:MAG: hypothetical protein A2X36_17205 [Elusimicrobia bacterium GWA2_69_24]HBL19087.1 prepilin-type cleavage/methylation domain-containing protein [Elusimicrobiota bacterium]